MTPLILLTIGLSLPFLSTQAQDTARVYDKIINAPYKFFRLLNKKSADYQQKVISQTDSYLRHLSKQEKALKKKLSQKDSLAAKKLFPNTDSLYQHWQQQLTSTATPATAQATTAQPPPQTPAPGLVYNGHLDSIRTALSFLEKNNLLGESKPLQDQLSGAMGQYGQLQNTLDQSEGIRQLVAARQQYLNTQLQQLGFVQAVKVFQKDMYYYQQQAKEYKEMFQKPEKMEAKLLEVLKNQPAFQQFFNKYSALAGIFRMPGAETSGSALAGMQTRESVMQDLQQRLGGESGAQQAMSQGIDQGQQQLDQLKNKLTNTSAGNSAGGEGMPDFTVNDQKKKRFLDRLELGTNVQSTRANYFFPTTTDLGLSIGYKLNAKSTLGIGASYKIGWGENIQHIHISAQGVGLRSFLDWKLKGSLWISGGAEMNYRNAFSSFSQLQDYSSWQRSALLGLSKKIGTGKKVNANVQLLYDFLYKQQVPQTQPILFRVGYSLK